MENEFFAWRGQLPTFSRYAEIATAPLLVYLLLLPSPLAAAFAATIFFLATITDFSRRLHRT